MLPVTTVGRGVCNFADGVTSTAGIIGFTAASAQQVTLLRGYNPFATVGERFELAAACTGAVDGAPPLMATPGLCEIGTTLVAPGAYEFVLCSPSYPWMMVAEAPPPAPTNATCPTSQVLTLATPYVEPRVVDGAPRYYSFTTATTATRTITVVPQTAYAGRFSISVDSECDGATVASGMLNMCAPIAPKFVLNALPAGTYFIAATGITPGADWSIQVD